MLSVLSTSSIPPSRDTLAGSMMLRLASGTATPTEVTSAYTELVSELYPELFIEFWPNSAPVPSEEVAQIVANVVTEHHRLIQRPSKDALALMSALVAADHAQLTVVFGDAVDDADAIEFARAMAEADAARGQRRRGWIYADADDLDTMILDGKLSFGYGSFDDAVTDEAIADILVQLLCAEGLAAHHEIATREVIVSDITFEVPIVE
ncbi:MAG: DUF6891 domain-containing protein [Propionibacteriaceae bacterium]